MVGLINAVPKIRPLRIGQQAGSAVKTQCAIPDRLVKTALPDAATYAMHTQKLLINLMFTAQKSHVFQRIEHSKSIKICWWPVYLAIGMKGTQNQLNEGKPLEPLPTISKHGNLVKHHLAFSSLTITDYLNK